MMERLMPYVEIVHITLITERSLTEARFFFGTPFTVRERGLNEHTNGLVRSTFPRDFHEVLGEDVRRVEELPQASEGFELQDSG